MAMFCNFYFILFLVLFLEQAIFCSADKYANIVDFPSTSLTRHLASFILPVAIAKREYRKGSLSKSGALLAAAIGYIMTMSNYCFMSAMLAFFFTSAKATRWRSAIKRGIDAEYRTGGQRNYLQVFCNGGVAAFLALLYIIDFGCKEILIDFSTNYTASWYTCGVLGALSCASADTLASEIGSAVGAQRVRLITRPTRLVPRGTNGGVTLVGLLASAVGGLVVAGGFYIPLFFSFPHEARVAKPFNAHLFTLCIAAGLFGSLVDSFLGATLQYSGQDTRTGHVVQAPADHVRHISGCHILDNHAVNLIAAVVTSLVTPRFAVVLQGKFVS